MNTPIAHIESLDYEGRGVARVDGKTIFIDGGLPGEQVTYRTLRRKANYEVAEVSKVLKLSNLRTTPECKHFGVCGGCAIQHLDVTGQVAAKQRMLEDNFWHIGKTRPERMLPAIYGPSWGYRHKARLRVRYVAKKGGVLVGFNEKATSFVADMDSCKVLPPHVSQLIPAMKELVASSACASHCRKLKWRWANLVQCWCCAYWRHCKPVILRLSRLSPIPTVWRSGPRAKARIPCNLFTRRKAGAELFPARI